MAFGIFTTGISLVLFSGYLFMAAAVAGILIFSPIYLLFGGYHGLQAIFIRLSEMGRMLLATQSTYVERLPATREKLARLAEGRQGVEISGQALQELEATTIVGDPGVNSPQGAKVIPLFATEPVRPSDVCEVDSHPEPIGAIYVYKGFNDSPSMAWIAFDELPEALAKELKAIAGTKGQPEATAADQLIRKTFAKAAR